MDCSGRGGWLDYRIAIGLRLPADSFKEDRGSLFRGRSVQRRQKKGGKKMRSRQSGEEEVGREG